MKIYMGHAERYPGNSEIDVKQMYENYAPVRFLKNFGDCVISKAGLDTVAKRNPYSRCGILTR
jgi:hypothetical protein